MPDPVPTLDNDDEIVFMARDAGPQAPLGAPAPPGTSDGQAIAIIDPLDPGSAKFVYLFRKAGRLVVHSGERLRVVRSRRRTRTNGSTATRFDADDPEKLGISNTGYGPNLSGTVCRTASYPDYPPFPDGTPRASTDRFVRDGVTVSTDTYRMACDAGDGWCASLRVAKPGQPGVYGPDLIDRWKGRAFQQSPDSTISLVGFEDEQVNWEANSALLGERDGPGARHPRGLGRRLGDERHQDGDLLPRRDRLPLPRPRASDPAGWALHVVGLQRRRRRQVLQHDQAGRRRRSTA